MVAWPCACTMRIEHGERGQWHFRTGLAADGRLVSGETEGFGRPEAVPRRFRFWTGWQIWSRRRGSTGAVTTACLR